MGAIFQASSFSFSHGLSVELPDLLFHFAEFFALGLLTARMVAPEVDGRLPIRSFLLASAIVLGYGFLDEIHQSFVPGRQPSGMDLLFDAAGGILGILAYPILFTGPRKLTSG
jgi:VanZ family protein